MRQLPSLALNVGEILYWWSSSWLPGLELTSLLYRTPKFISLRTLWLCAHCCFQHFCSHHHLQRPGQYMVNAQEPCHLSNCSLSSLGLFLGLWGWGSIIISTYSVVLNQVSHSFIAIWLLHAGSHAPIFKSHSCDSHREDKFFNSIWINSIHNS